MTPGKEALVLFLKASKILPPDFIDLEPETVCQIMGIDRKECAKIFAMATVVHHHAVFENYHIFEKAVVTLNDHEGDFTVTQEINTCEIVWAVKTIRMMDDVHPFNNEVLAAIAIYLHEEGFLKVPESLTNEKSTDSLNIQYMLDRLNRNHEPLGVEGTKVQKHLHTQVSNYLSDRIAKLNSELKHEGLVSK